MTVDPHRFVDRSLFHNEAQYRAEVQQMKMMISFVEAAMEDEGVDPRVCTRVLERLVYGMTPHPRDAYARIDLHQERVADAVRPGSAPNQSTGLPVTP